MSDTAKPDLLAGGAPRRHDFCSREIHPPEPERVTNAPTSVVIVGGGAAGLAAADMLRPEGYGGPLSIVGPMTLHPSTTKDSFTSTTLGWCDFKRPDKPISLSTLPSTET